jgi:CHAT domain-containing protein
LFAVIGSVYLAADDYKKAGEYYANGLMLARRIGLRQTEALILAALGFLHEKQGNMTKAESFYDQEIAVSESLRSSAHIEEFKTELGGVFAGLLHPAILLKFKLGKWSEAFELTEKARARTFLDQLNNVHVDFRKRSDPKLVEQEQSLRFTMRALEEKLREERRNNPSSEAARSMTASLKEQEETYAALLIRLKASDPDYAELRSYAPIPLKQVQRLLGPQRTLVSYFVTADKLLAFVISSDSLHAVEVPVKESELRANIEWFRDFASLRDPHLRSLTQLHNWLIAPVRKYIKTAEVTILPHGILHYVPFAALTDGSGYFGDEHTINYLPSASVLPSIRRRVGLSGTRVLAVAQSRADDRPSLRYADEEAAKVAELYHAQALLTGKGTRAEFLRRASACNILHVAAHAELNAHGPLFSRILLSPNKDDNGAIEVREVYGIDLSTTNLVVLSACQTVLGAQSKGDEVVGLNRAFIYAGASSVIASLWTVDDEATSYLMRAFYANLRKGQRKAAALQSAQKATRGKYPHPYYWAAFILSGDPGNINESRFPNPSADTRPLRQLR